jgi:hypothetical protein
MTTEPLSICFLFHKMMVTVNPTSSGMSIKKKLIKYHSSSWHTLGAYEVSVALMLPRAGTCLISTSPASSTPLADSECLLHVC